MESTNKYQYLYGTPDWRTGGGANDALGGLRCPQSSFATITLVIVTLRCHDVVFITGDFIKRISGDFYIYTYTVLM